MYKAFESYLFSKHLLISSDGQGKDVFETLFSLATLFGIRIISGQEMARPEMIRTASNRLGRYVPMPFYKNFPQSVRELSKEEKRFDQLLHYARTYGFGDFSAPDHSVFERDFERAAFKEETQIRDFSIITEEETVRLLRGKVDDLLKSTRPLSEEQYNLVLEFIRRYEYTVSHCASKDTLVKLLLDTRDVSLAGFLQMTDVIRVLDHLSYQRYKNENLKKLNLKNQDRKFLKQIINVILKNGQCNLADCYEKKKLFSGLLHHIHYQPKNEQAQAFVNAMRGRDNQSVYSAFEKHMHKGEIREAVQALKDGKGSGALLRKLSYILSRCKTQEDVDALLASIETNNPLILIQLLMTYSLEPQDGQERTFKFTRHNLLKIHTESQAEAAHRHSFVPDEIRERVLQLLKENLRRIYHGRLGKVYIAPGMQRIAVPLQETTASGGFGTLPRGSRMPIKAGKKVRAFTYWEMVNDVDLSIIALMKDGFQAEFSWRTMWNEDCMVYSGDQTSGYDGGSEYFDIDLDEFTWQYPNAEYLICCNNVYSELTFDQCVCTAGYMEREALDSGEIFEPKTVKTSFKINCKSTFAYLFAIDLKTREIIWLNTSRDSSEHVAGKTSLEFLRTYFDYAQVFSLRTLFEMMATEVVDNPMEADVVLTNEELPVREGAEVIHSYDMDRILALMNA
ncbi:MAG: hypothetical protein IKU34_02300 [Clostridia bacterium]|nr:hypothetical protein [Clostridia bacterium]